jgi:hypothetical protein
MERVNLGYIPGGQNLVKAVVDRVVAHNNEVQIQLDRTRSELESAKKRLRLWAVGENGTEGVDFRTCSFCDVRFPYFDLYNLVCPGQCHTWCGDCKQTKMKRCPACDAGYCSINADTCSCGATFCVYCGAAWNCEQRDHPYRPTKQE